MLHIVSLMFIFAGTDAHVWKWIKKKNQRTTNLKISIHLRYSYRVSPKAGYLGAAPPYTSYLHVIWLLIKINFICQLSIYLVYNMF